MDVAAGIKPAGRWLERSAPATYQRALIWIAALSLAYYATAVAVYARLMMPTLPSVAVLWPPNVLLFVGFLLAPVRLWPLVICLRFRPSSLSRRPWTFRSADRSGCLPGISRSRSSPPRFSAGSARASAARNAARRHRVHPRRGTWRSGDCVGRLRLDPQRHRLDHRSLAALADAVCHQCPLDDGARAAAADFSSLALAASPARSTSRGVPDSADLSTASERLVNSLVTSVTFYPLLFAPLPFLLWAAVRFGQAGLGIVLCFTALFRFLANAHPGQASSRRPMRSSRRSSRSSRSHCR